MTFIKQLLSIIAKISKSYLPMTEFIDICSCYFNTMIIFIIAKIERKCRDAPPPPTLPTPPKIGKNMIFVLKIVIFHTKYPKFFF